MKKKIDFDLMVKEYRENYLRVNGIEYPIKEENFLLEKGWVKKGFGITMRISRFESILDTMKGRPSLLEYKEQQKAEELISIRNEIRDTSDKLRDLKYKESRLNYEIQQGQMHPMS